MTEPAAESAPVARAAPKPEVAVTPPNKWPDLAAVLDRHRGERLLVLLSGYPDPDSIASGLALQLLAQPFDVDSTLLSFFEVSHQENRALVKRLELDLHLYGEHFHLDP